MKISESHRSQEQRGGNNGAAKEGDSAPCRPSGVEGLREYIFPDGPTVDTEAVANLREFIRERTAKTGNPHGLNENQIIRAAALQAHQLMQRMQERTLTRGVPFPVAAAMRAGVINTINPVRPHALTEPIPGSKNPRDPVTNYHSLSGGRRIPN